MLTAIAGRTAIPRPHAVASSEREPLIYLAGPYTYPDPVANTHRVLRIADALLEVGVVPIVPHLTLLWHFVSPKPYGRWLDYDRKIIDRCDALLLIPGHSPGATDEADYAAAQDIPVLRPHSSTVADCVAAVTRWRDRFVEDDEDDCPDCGRFHIFCRCGGGGAG